MPVATRFCHIHARGNGGRGSRHHPPWPPLSKGGKGYAARSGSFQEGTVAEARVTTFPAPPSQGGERYTAPSDRATRTLASQSTLQSSQYQLFTTPGSLSRDRAIAFSPSSVVTRGLSMWKWAAR